MIRRCRRGAPCPPQEGDQEAGIRGRFGKLQGAAGQLAWSRFQVCPRHVHGGVISEDNTWGTKIDSGSTRRSSSRGGGAADTT